MKVMLNKHLFYLGLIAVVWSLGIGASFANSDLFPPQQNAPALTSYVSGGTFKHTYYISPTGNDSTGNGSIGNPWQSFNGANTGGSGVPVAAGDLVYFRGGVYPTHLKAAWKVAYYDLKRSGTASDYIVFTNYPGETPQFSGGEGMPSFSIHGNYVVINGLTFNAGGNFGIDQANHIVLQNSTFTGVCADGWGDQVLGTCIGLGDSVDSVTIRNNYFGPSSSTHALKSYTSTSVTTNVKVLYNRFYGITPYYAVINNKGPMQNWEIAYNRFQDCQTALEYGITYGFAYDSGAVIHHNVFDNVQKVIERGGGDTRELRSFHVYDNVIFNSASGNTDFLKLNCADTGCVNSASQPIGEFYNNVIYDIANAINITTNTNFVNYPSYWNYNAYQSAGDRSTAINKNSLGSASWQGNSVITSDTIHITGNSGNRFYYISDNSPLRNMGRNGDTIGGFTWGTDPIRPMPPMLQ